jgi:hypothetical protein
MSPSRETQILNGAATTFQTKALNGNGTANGNGVTNGHKIATDVDDLKDRLHVERSSKAFGSRAVSLIDLPAGSLFLKITKATPATKGAFPLPLPFPLYPFINKISLYIRPNLRNNPHRVEQ